MKSDLYWKGLHPIPGATAFFSLPDVSVKVHSFSYTAYGEQMGAVKSSGFTYNAEAFDAATGMLNLRARQYEAGIGRFNQKDIVRGQISSPLSFNRYAYCASSPVMHSDPSGKFVLDSIGNWWDKTRQTAIGKVLDAVIVKPVTSVVKAMPDALNIVLIKEK